MKENKERLLSLSSHLRRPQTQRQRQRDTKPTLRMSRGEWRFSNRRLSWAWKFWPVHRWKTRECMAVHVPELLTKGDQHKLRHGAILWCSATQKHIQETSLTVLCLADERGKGSWRYLYSSIVLRTGGNWACWGHPSNLMWAQWSTLTISVGISLLV